MRTIIAQCSGRGSGAIALLRISGPDAIKIADIIGMLSSKKKLKDLLTHTIHHGFIVTEDAKHIDEVLFLLMLAPRTFTGEDTVEITCHNNPFIIENIIARACAVGAHVSNPGEFSEQAVVNQKIDLLQAEGINELIHASSVQAIEKAQQQVEGSLSAWIAHIEQRLLLCSALAEVTFEFVEEEVDFSTEIKAEVGAIKNEIYAVRSSYALQKYIREGIRIACIGSVNAGKSSLFNALMGNNRAIVSDIPGTTRDVIEAGLYRNGIYWTLVDTAGIRQTDDLIEHQGIDRSYQEANKADIVLLIADGSMNQSKAAITIYTELYNSYCQKSIVVQSKFDVDQQKLPIQADIFVSITQPESIDSLRQLLEKKIATMIESHQSTFLLNQRHYHILAAVEEALNNLEGMFEGVVYYELVSLQIQQILQDTSQLSGKSVSEEMMNTVFRSFCVGK
jgi:tRNA modification GTPase